MSNVSESRRAEWLRQANALAVLAKMAAAQGNLKSAERFDEMMKNRQEGCQRLRQANTLAVLAKMAAVQGNLKSAERFDEMIRNSQEALLSD